MSKNRYLPFGYHVQNGEIILHPNESNVVTQIFNKTIDGKSLNDIAKFCNEQNVPYSENKHEWTKHMVRRVLENNKYYDNPHYPLLISQETFEQAHKIRTQKSETQTDDVKLIRKYIYCGLCGEKIYFNKQKDDLYKCTCKNCGSETQNFSVFDFQELINYKLQKIFIDDEVIKPPKNSATKLPIELIKAEQEIKRLTEQGKIESNDILSAIFNKTAIHYNICSAGESDPPTLYLKSVAKEPVSSEFDENTFTKTVKKVLIGRNNIALKLINNQII